MISVGNPVCIFHLQHISISTSHFAVLKDHMWLMAAILDGAVLMLNPQVWHIVSTCWVNGREEGEKTGTIRES